MKKLYVSDDWFSIQQVAQLLDANRIPYVVKNEFAAGAVGELAPQDVLPEVWLLEDDWFAKATELLNDLKHVAVDATDWVCNECGEHNESTFAICWHCSTIRADIGKLDTKAAANG